MFCTLFFIFIDGLGLGADDAAENPLAALSLPAFERLAGDQRWLRSASSLSRPDHVFRPIDATLGLDGLPQSGTGQASLLTGENCARLAGRHYGPFPHSKTRPVLAARNLFTQVQQLGLPFDEPAIFVNAYPNRFFQYVRQRDRWTVTTRCCLEAGLRIRTHADLLAGLALPADITAETWPQSDPRLVPVTEEQAAERLLRLRSHHALVLFEYFHSDKAGHSRSRERAASVLLSLDRFFQGLLSHLDPEHDMVLITSDHGNLEDLSTRTHTRNPVPLIAYGRGAHHFASVQDLTGVTPAIVAALREAYS